MSLLRRALSFTKKKNDQEKPTDPPQQPGYNDVFRERPLIRRPSIHNETHFRSRTPSPGGGPPRRPGPPVRFHSAPVLPTVSTPWGHDYAELVNDLLTPSPKHEKKAFI